MFGLKNRRPTSEDAAVRAYLLKFVVVSALALPPKDLLDAMSSTWPQSDRDGFSKDLAANRRARRDSLGRWKARLSPKEDLFSSVSPERITPQRHADALWRLESFQTLLWALGLVDRLPGYDAQADQDLLKTFPPSGEIGVYLKQARLRPSAEIERQRDLAELWHWRSRTRWLIETGAPLSAASGFESYDQIVRSIATKDAGGIGPVTDEDFTAFGKAYRDLTEDQWSIVRSITMERHFALNWLCGYAPGNQWDDTPTDT